MSASSLPSLQDLFWLQAVLGLFCQIIVWGQAVRDHNQVSLCQYLVLQLYAVASAVSIFFFFLL